MHRREVPARLERAHSSGFGLLKQQSFERFVVSRHLLPHLSGSVSSYGLSIVSHYSIGLAHPTALA